MKALAVALVFAALAAICQAGYFASPYYYNRGYSRLYRYPHYGFGSWGIPRSVYGYGRYGGYGYGGYGGYGGFGGFPSVSIGL